MTRKYEYKVGESAVVVRRNLWRNGYESLVMTVRRRQWGRVWVGDPCTSQFFDTSTEAIGDGIRRSSDLGIPLLTDVQECSRVKTVVQAVMEALTQ